MPYLARLIEQSRMVVGTPHAGAAERTAPALQPLELDSVRDAPPPAGAESTPRPEPTRPGPAPAAASADATPQRVGDSAAEIVVAMSEPRVAPAATAAPRQAPASAPASMQHAEIVERTPSAVSRQPVQAEAAPSTAPRGPVTLAEVRAWVAATPALDELRLAPRQAAPIEVNEIAVAAADVDVPPPTRRATREPTQDVHLTIGSIVVTVEGPERTPAAPAPPPSRPAQPRRDIGASTRLLRHYLRS